jgi:hypothetical protein
LSDKWISEIYKPIRSMKITDWTVRHERIHGKMSMELYQYVQSIKVQDKLLIEKYLRWHDFCETILVNQPHEYICSS